MSKRVPSIFLRDPLAKLNRDRFNFGFMGVYMKRSIYAVCLLASVVTSVVSFANGGRALKNHYTLAREIDCELAENLFSSRRITYSNQYCSASISFQVTDRQGQYGTFEYTVTDRFNPDGAPEYIEGTFWLTNSFYSDGSQKMLLNLGNQYPQPGRSYRAAKLFGNAFTVVWNSRTHVRFNP
jgi:hypothetical protein